MAPGAAGSVRGEHLLSHPDLRHRLPSELPTVQVAYANDATLSPQTGSQFTITPRTDSRQNLDEGTQRPDGGYSLTWSWTVVPRTSGRLTLILEIQPFVVVEGSPVTGLARRNKPISIQVEVNKVQREFDGVVASASNLSTALPEMLIVDDDVAVTASLPLKPATLVRTDVVLRRAETSVPVTIVPMTGSGADGVTRWRWRVTAAAPGPVDLVFDVRVRARAGDAPLDFTVPVHRSLKAAPPPASFWSNVQKPVLYLTPFIAFVLAAITLFRTIRRRQRGNDSDAANLDS